MTKETKEAIKKAFDAMSDDWRKKAWLHLINYAKSHDVFLIKDVNEWALKEKGFVSKKGGKAWGAIALKANRLNIIEKDKVVPSDHAHGATVTRWKSLILDK